MRTLYIDFDKLNITPDLKELFSKEILSTIKEKYKDSQIYITDNQEAASIASEHGAVKTIYIHNDQIIDFSDEALGNAFPSEGIAEVDVSDFVNQGFHLTGDLAEKIGTVAAHEGYHLLGPIGHSLEGGNLMSTGELIIDDLMNNNGQNLEFTNLQKALLLEDVNYDSGVDLSAIEQVYEQDYSNLVEIEDIQDALFDILDSLS